MGRFSILVDFWQEPAPINNFTAHIMITSQNRDKVNKYLQNRHIRSEILHSNVETLIENERKALIKADHLFQLINANNKVGNTSEAIAGFWTKYHRYEDINRFMDELSKKSNNLVEKFVLGESYEKRTIYYIRISDSKESEKPVIYIQGGIHAREWISTAVVTYFAQQLVNGVINSDLNTLQLIKKFDFYITPVLNVDGYEYSHIQRRLWRKTRSINGRSISDCRGVDPNRNYDFHWGKKGSSSYLCSETYSGKKAFSEPEIRAEADFIKKKLGKRVKVYIAVHSYNQLWLYPWGHEIKNSPHVEKLSEKAKIATEALYKRYKTRFQYGSSIKFQDVTSGESIDWAHGKASIPYAYQVELRDTGEYGFLLPPDQIRPSGEEITDAFKAMFLSISKEL
ncbi:Sodium-dependent noradrenaline transporter [Dermatophagoides farinae]|uniref:Sodium-dependent noradrenaline transporter n=1 Tax=Dermatophagoides farinae TaxID=6954 RepID=A0A922ICP2_DERFA|nr:Sodium-dependent noradrenaline transporter [Dermatophagoides farinae]